MLPPPAEMNQFYGEYDLPGGRIRIPRDQFGNYGIEAPPDEPPPLPPQPLELQQPPGLPGAGPELAAPGALPTQQPPSAPPQAEPSGHAPHEGVVAVPPTEAPPLPAPPPGEPAPPNLNKMTRSDALAADMAASRGEVAATQSLGGIDSQEAELQSANIAARNTDINAKTAASETKRLEDAQEVAKSAKVWKDKEKEHMDMKVQRRNMGAMEFIGVALSGLGAALKGQGDKNPALDFVMNKIEKDLDDQWRQKDQLGKDASALKGSVDYARDVATDNNAQRIAAIGMEAQKYAREGEAIVARMAPGRKKEEAAFQVAQLKSAAAQKLGQAFETDQTAKRADKTLNEQIRNNKAQVGATYAQIHEQHDQFKKTLANTEGQQSFTNENARQLTEIERSKAYAAAAAAAGKGSEGSIAAQKLALETEEKHSSRTIQSLFPRTVLDKDGKPTGQVELRAFRKKDGTPLMVANPELANKLSAKLEASQQYVAAVDRMQELRDLHGSEWFTTDAAREMMVNYTEAVVRKKDAWGLGALSTADQKLASGGIGTLDPNELRDITAGLQESRKRDIEATRTSLRNAGYDNEKAEPYDIPNLTRQGLQEEADTGSAGAQVKALESSSRDRERAFDIAKEGNNLSLGSASAMFGGQGDAASNALVSNKEKAQIESILGSAMKGDKAARAGLAKLTKNDKLGAATREIIAASGIDLSDKLPEAEWAAIVKAQPPRDTWRP